MNSKKVPNKGQLEHRADTLNKNRGTPGTNVTYAKLHGNRGKQKNATKPPTAC